MKRRLVIFDVDGTLVDSQHDIVAAMDHAFEAQGLVPPSRAATLAIVGLSVPEAIRALAPHLAVRSQEAIAQNFRAGGPAQRDCADAMFETCPSTVRGPSRCPRLRSATACRCAMKGTNFATSVALRLDVNVIGPTPSEAQR